MTDKANKAVGEMEAEQLLKAHGDYDTYPNAIRHAEYEAELLRRLELGKEAEGLRKRVDQLSGWLNDAAHEVGSDLDTVASAIRRKLAEAERQTPKPEPESVASVPALGHTHRAEDSIAITNVGPISSRGSLGAGEIETRISPYCPECGTEFACECEPETAPSAGAQELVLRLSQHWLIEMVCDHGGQTDQALCFCGWRSEPCYNVGGAVVAWGEHVASKLSVGAQELKDAQAALERDRTKVAECLEAVKKELRAYDWLLEGRGCYEWDDDRWHDEFRRASVAIWRAIDPMVAIAADWTNCPQTTAEVQAARASLTPIQPQPSATPPKKHEPGCPARADDEGDWVLADCGECSCEADPAPLAEELARLARAIIERVTRDAVALAITRSNLEWDADLEQTEEDIIADAIGVTTGDDMGCLPEDAATPENCTHKFVEAALASLGQPAGKEKP